MACLNIPFPHWPFFSQSSGKMSCSQGRTRGKIHLVQTKRRSQLLCQISSFIIWVSTEWVSFFLLQSCSVLCVYLSHPLFHTCLYIHLYFLNIRTTIYCLHVTRLGYTGGLDSSQKGTMPRRCIVWSCSSVGRARIVGSIPDTTYTCMCDCKSLWIKASAKCNLLLY